MKAHNKWVLGFTAVGALALTLFWLRPRAENTAVPAARVAAAQPSRAVPPAELAAAHASRDTTSAAPQAAAPAATPDAKLLALIPAGNFRDNLLRLDEPVRRRALAKLAKLQVPSEDFASLRASPDGALYYVCALPASLTRTATHAGVALASKGSGSSGTTTTQAATAGTAVAISTPPVRHSRAGSNNVLYLDFSGYTVTNTRWNTTYGAKTYTALAYDTDGDRTTFSADEQAAIVQIWE